MSSSVGVVSQTVPVAMSQVLHQHNYENQALFCHASLLHFNLVTEIYVV